MVILFQHNNYQPPTYHILCAICFIAFILSVCWPNLEYLPRLASRVREMPCSLFIALVQRRFFEFQNTDQ